MKIIDIFKRLFQERALCGHPTKQRDKVKAFGEYVVTTLPRNNEGRVEYCHKCLEKMAILCAWCTKPIFIGDPVTLYGLEKNKLGKIPSEAVLYEDRGEIARYVGCLRWTCANTGADRNGFWLPGKDGKGHVRGVVPSPLEIALQSGQGIYVADLNNP